VTGPRGMRPPAFLLFGLALAGLDPVAGQEPQAGGGQPALSEALPAAFSSLTELSGYPVVASQRFLLGGRLAPGELGELAVLAENVWRDLAGRFSAEWRETAGGKPARKRLVLFFASRADGYDSWEFLRRHTDPPIPMALRAHILHSRQASLDGPGVDLFIQATDRRSLAASCAARAWIHEYAFLPEGFACIAPSRRRPERVKAFFSDWAALIRCRRTARSWAAGSEDRGETTWELAYFRKSAFQWASARSASREMDLAQLSHPDLTRMSGVERALGFAFVDYCVQARPGALEVLLRCVRNGWAAREAFHQAFDGLSEAEFFRALKEWVASAYA